MMAILYFASLTAIGALFVSTIALGGFLFFRGLRQLGRILRAITGDG